MKFWCPLFTVKKFGTGIPWTGDGKSYSLATPVTHHEGFPRKSINTGTNISGIGGGIRAAAAGLG